MRGAWWVVFKKEALETLRDRRTLLTMVVVPVLLYPALLIVSEQLLLFGQRSLESQRSPVAIVGAAPPAELVELIDARERLELRALAGSPEAALRADSVAAIVVLGPGAQQSGTQEVTLLFDAASDRSQRGRAELASVLSAWGDTLLSQRLTARGLSTTFATPVSVADSSIARPDEIGGYTIGRVLPLLLVVITLLGAFYPAIDLAAGEKERGTLETILTTPVPSEAVVAGKFVTVALVGIVAAGLNLGSMLLTFQTGLLQFSELVGLEVSIPFGSVLVIFLTLIPLAVLFGALFLGLAVRSASFKEAQNALTPVYMLVLIPAMLPIFPGIEFGPVVALVPVAGVSFLFRDLMVGDAGLLMGLLVLLSTGVYALMALLFAARSFGSERVLFGTDDGEMAGLLRGAPRGRVASEKAVPRPEAAIGLVLAIALLFFYGAIRLQLAFGESGLIASEWLLLFAPALLFVLLGRYDLRATLSLARPTPAALIAGVLLIAGSVPFVWLVGWLQTFVLPIPWELLEGLEELVTADSAGRFVWLLLVLAVTPALCEEIVFRGVLLGSTRTLTPRRMIMLNGVVFGAFHLSFETAIRFLPTALLGILIAWVVWRTGSIWVGVLMHFLNNALVVAVASVPLLREALSDPRMGPPSWLVPLGAALFLAGLMALRADDSS